MREKRTKIDFSNHECVMTKNGDLLIHHLKRPNSIQDNVKFINTCGRLIVTGDYSSWLFCREFWPDAENSVSDGYWLEKLRIDSCQEPCKYDSEETERQINEKIAELDDEYEIDSERYKEMKAYYERCLQYVNDEWEYIQEARDFPSYCDYDVMMVGKVLNVQLPYVFDAFDEICRRMKEKGIKYPKEDNYTLTF